MRAGLLTRVFSLSFEGFAHVIISTDKWKWMFSLSGGISFESTFAEREVNQSSNP